MPKVSGFQFNRPQQLAALLLLLLLAQCLWVFHRQTLTSRDYDFARCGREMWEKPDPLAGYFTSCGNISDGTLAYRIAGLPLTLQRVLAGQAADASTWEMRHELGYVLLLLHSGFLLTGILLGGALWWVTRRLYGNTGGFIALAFYCFCPLVIHACTYPNNEILTAFGLFASLYTAMGVAHAMQGPMRKWRSRIVLLTLTLAFTAASHVAAFLLALLLSIVLMAYLAVGRRAYIVPIMMAAVIGTLLLLFASYDFSMDAYSYFFRSGAGRISFSLQTARHWFFSLPNSAVTVAAATALMLYLPTRRSRYFGNTVPLLLALLFMTLITPGISSEPTLWALPFLLTFIAGVFADFLETRYRPLFLGVAGCLLVLAATLSILSLP
ncbi:MAG: hypothetical protein ABSC65_09215 [Acidobacteriaceae bacterium]|jgi:hypothetical protein